MTDSCHNDIQPAKVAGDGRQYSEAAWRVYKLQCEVERLRWDIAAGNVDPDADAPPYSKAALQRRKWEQAVGEQDEVD